jgi:hypothetical protein
MPSSCGEVATSTLVAAPSAIVLNRIGAPLIVWVVAPVVAAAARNCATCSGSM